MSEKPMTLTADQKNKFKKAVDGGATFMFRPYASIKSLIAGGNDPIISSLPDFMKEAILMCLDGQGIWLDPKFIIKKLEGNLDSKNSYILSMGEIRVVGAGDFVIKPEELKRTD